MLGGRWKEVWLDIGGVLFNRWDAVHLHHGAFPRSTGLINLPFKGPCDILESPASGLRDFEEGEDQEHNEESGKHKKNIGSQIDCSWGKEQSN